MRLYVAKRNPIECTSDCITMVLFCAKTLDKCESLMHAFNQDREIRTSGGAPLDMEGPEWEWDVVGIANEAETEARILHYIYNS